MKSLNEDLKTGQFKQVYLLYGEENYLKKQYKDKLSKAMLPPDDTMNYAYYEGKGADVNEIIANTYLSFDLIDYPEADHFVIVKFVVGERRKHAERQIELRAN